MQKKMYVQLDPKDNVMVALQDLPQEMEIITGDGSTLKLTEKIPAKHKFFLQDIGQGSNIIMYGVLVGKAQQDIAKGSRMNVFNTKHAADPYRYRGNIKKWKAPDVSHFSGRTFNGYHRNDGRVGTANYWLFIPTVFCENRNLDVIREALHNELGYAVSDKYKRFTRNLVNAVKEGKNIDTGDFSIFGPQANKERLFENVDGIKVLEPPGRMWWHEARFSGTECSALRHMPIIRMLQA
jgi:altronate hydrolase